jgi:phosphatidylinositol-3-phosphatase
MIHMKLRSTIPVIVSLAAVTLAAACSGTSSAGDVGSNTDAGASSSDGSTNGGDGSSSGGDGSAANDGATGSDKVIFVIPMENKAQTQIYGDMTDAPYINGTLLTAYPHTTNFGDELPALESEPHYVWMESGANQFSDHTFSTDDDPSPTNSTSSTAHLVTQLQASGISWTSYQEGITAGTCPINSVTANFYAAKHDPFVFFQDVVGNPPSASNANCANHHKPITALSGDLTTNAVAAYNFITPNLCHEMHGDKNCPQGTATAANITAGDNWLKDNLPPIIDYALAHNGYVFVTWDEGDATNLIPFIAIGKNAIAARPGAVAYTHSSLLKSEEEIFGVPVLASAAGAADFSDLFTSFP